MINSNQNVLRCLLCYPNRDVECSLVCLNLGFKAETHLKYNNLEVVGILIETIRLMNIKNRVSVRGEVVEHSDV